MLVNKKTEPKKHCFTKTSTSYTDFKHSDDFCTWYFNERQSHFDERKTSQNASNLRLIFHIHARFYRQRYITVSVSNTKASVSTLRAFVARALSLSAAARSPVLSRARSQAIHPSTYISLRLWLASDSLPCYTRTRSLSSLSLDVCPSFARAYCFSVYSFNSGWQCVTVINCVMCVFVPECVLQTQNIYRQIYICIHTAKPYTFDDSDGELFIK